MLTISKAALARLRSYKPPPFPIWDSLPVSRRAAVLLLLFSDRHGALRVVITMRAASLRNYSGHAALPGGKADTTTETPFHIARREAYEEIGLPLDDAKFPKPFRIEHLCQLPFNLAKTELAVAPCVAFLHSDGASVEETMIPRLDAKEVAAVFSAPFHNFLRAEDELLNEEVTIGDKKDWYKGAWTDWHQGRWRMHEFHVPINHQKVTKPKVREGGLSSIDDEGDNDVKEEAQRYKVWGMTARILVDAARVAYGEDPEFEVRTNISPTLNGSANSFQHNDHFGDEKMMEVLFKMGRMGEKKNQIASLSEAEMSKVAQAAARGGSPPPAVRSGEPNRKL